MKSKIIKTSDVYLPLRGNLYLEIFDIQIREVLGNRLGRKISFIMEDISGWIITSLFIINTIGVGLYFFFTDIHWLLGIIGFLITSTLGFVMAVGVFIGLTGFQLLGLDGYTIITLFFGPALLFWGPCVAFVLGYSSLKLLRMILSQVVKLLP